MLAKPNTSWDKILSLVADRTGIAKNDLRMYSEDGYRVGYGTVGESELENGCKVDILLGMVGYPDPSSYAKMTAAGTPDPPYGHVLAHQLIIQLSHHLSCTQILVLHEQQKKTV